MHPHVFVLKCLLICLLKPALANAGDSGVQPGHHTEQDHQQLRSAGDYWNDTVRVTEDSGRDIIVLKEPSTVALEAAAVVDNHLTDVEVNAEKGAGQGEAPLPASAALPVHETSLFTATETPNSKTSAIPEPSAGSGSNVTDEDAALPVHETSLSTAEKVATENPNSKTSAIPEPSAGSGSNVTDEDVKKGDDYDKVPLLESATVPENVPEDPLDSASGEPWSAAVSEPSVSPSNLMATDRGTQGESPVTDEDPIILEPLDTSSGDASTATLPEPSTDSGIHLADMEAQSALGNRSATDSAPCQEGAGDCQEPSSGGEDTPASLVESEGMFTVKVRPPVALEQTMEEPMYSGDGPLEPYNLTAWFDSQPGSSGDDQIESHVSSGEAELTTNPVAAPRNLHAVVRPPSKLPPLNVSEVEDLGVRRLSCEGVACQDHQRLQVSASSSGGLVIPAGVTLTVRCSAQSLGNDTAVLRWHLPPHPNGTLDEVERRVNITEDVLELRGHDKRVSISVLRVVNVSEADAGRYTCAAVLTGDCCQSNATVDMQVYVPPSYAVDFAIVGAVCFVEFLVILYFKTRSDRQGRVKTPAGREDNGYKADYQPLPLEARSKEVQIEDEEQQRLT